MIRLNQKDNIGYFKSVLMAYFILLLHVVLVAGLLMMVIFFHGIVSYMMWIFIAGSVAIAASGYHFYKRMKKEGKTLREMMRSQLLSGRTVEISLLGGFASVKVADSSAAPKLGSERSKQPPQQLEDPAAIQMRELSELVRLLENNQITLDEYNRMKHQIFNS